MSRIGPQGQVAGTGLIIVESIFPLWTTVLDLSTPGSFTPEKIRIVNMSGSPLSPTTTAIRLFVSYKKSGADPTDVHDVLDPNIDAGLILDNERMADKVIRLTLPAGSLTTCECYITVSA